MQVKRRGLAQVSLAMVRTSLYVFLLHVLSNMCTWIVPYWECCELLIPEFIPFLLRNLAVVEVIIYMAARCAQSGINHQLQLRQLNRPLI